MCFMPFTSFFVGRMTKTKKAQTYTIITTGNKNKRQSTHGVDKRFGSQGELCSMSKHVQEIKITQVMWQNDGSRTKTETFTSSSFFYTKTDTCTKVRHMFFTHYILFLK